MPFGVQVRVLSPVFPIASFFSEAKNEAFIPLPFFLRHPREQNNLFFNASVCQQLHPSRIGWHCPQSCPLTLLLCRLGKTPTFQLIGIGRNLSPREVQKGKKSNQDDGQDRNDLEDLFDDTHHENDAQYGRDHQVKGIGCQLVDDGFHGAAQCPCPVCECKRRNSTRQFAGPSLPSPISRLSSRPCIRFTTRTALCNARASIWITLPISTARRFMFTAKRQSSITIAVFPMEWASSIARFAMLPKRTRISRY